MTIREFSPHTTYTIMARDQSNIIKVKDAGQDVRVRISIDHTPRPTFFQFGDESSGANNHSLAILGARPEIFRMKAWQTHIAVACQGEWPVYITIGDDPPINDFCPAMSIALYPTRLGSGVGLGVSTKLKEAGVAARVRLLAEYKGLRPWVSFGDEHVNAVGDHYYLTGARDYLESTPLCEGQPEFFRMNASQTHISLNRGGASPLYIAVGE